MAHQQRHRTRQALLVCGLIVLLFIPFIPAETDDLPLIGFLERKSRDLRFLIRGAVPPSGEVVIGAIDDRSIEAIGRWPWPRMVLAQAIRRLQEAGAAAVAVDLLLSEAEANPAKAVVRKLMNAYAELGLLTGDVRSRAFYGEMEDRVQALENDAILGAVAEDAGNVILGMAFLPYETPAASPVFLEKAALQTDMNSQGISGFDPIAFAGALLPMDRLARSAASLGFVNVLPNPDGAVRSGLLAIGHRDRIYLSLGVQAVEHYHRSKGMHPEISLPAEGLHIGEHPVPTDRNGQIRINYYGPAGTLPRYSIIDILTGDVGKAELQGKIVFIGGAAVGLGDHWPNPYSEFFWGVETHATVADNLLMGNSLRRPEWSGVADLVTLLLAALLMGLAVPRIPVSLSLPFALLIGLLYLGFTQHLFNTRNLLFSWTLPMIALWFMAVALLLLRYFTEVREKRFLKTAFSHYVNQSVVDRVLHHPEKLVLGGEKKDLTVLFSDIRDFTAISEKLEPEDLVRFMNHYLTAMSDIILTDEGTVDKYIGDAIMAVYGAPEDQSNHADRACATAVRMMQGLGELQDNWGVKGISGINVGIGINTGPMVVGNMGSDRRFDYTVMGDNVNLASRLEGLTKLYRVGIIVSEFTQKAVRSAFAFRELDWVRVKGRAAPVRIYELLGEDDDTGGEYRFVSPFEEGLDAYRRGRWDHGISCFESALALKPGDAPALLLKERCERLKKNPPQMPWDGVCIAPEK